MTTGTNNNQDDELDKLLRQFVIAVDYPNNPATSFPNIVMLKASILYWHNQQLEQAVIEARIDEVSHSLDASFNADKWQDHIDYLEERLSKLSKSKEKKA